MKRKSLYIIYVFISIATTVFSQSKDYKCCIQNIKNPDPKTIEFDVFLEWEGMDSPKFTFLQAGINFNYDDIANGGTITGAYKQGSADKSLPRYQQSPKWNINQNSKQIRLLAAICPDSAAVNIPPPPGFRLGTFVMTNTVPFKNISRLNLEWSFTPGSATKTVTKISIYQPVLAMPKDVTVPGNHCIKRE